MTTAFTASDRGVEVPPCDLRVTKETEKEVRTRQREKIHLKKPAKFLATSGCRKKIRSFVIVLS